MATAASGTPFPFPSLPGLQKPSREEWAWPPLAGGARDVPARLPMGPALAGLGQELFGEKLPEKGRKI